MVEFSKFLLLRLSRQIFMTHSEPLWSLDKNMIVYLCLFRSFRSHLRSYIVEIVILKKWFVKVPEVYNIPVWEASCFHQTFVLLTHIIRNLLSFFNIFFELEIKLLKSIEIVVKMMLKWLYQLKLLSFDLFLFLRFSYLFVLFHIDQFLFPPLMVCSDSSSYWSSTTIWLIWLIFPLFFKMGSDLFLDLFLCL